MQRRALLHPKLLEVAERYGYTSFNDVQLRAFDALSKGVHVVIIAPTGYGKTEAALFPIMGSILEEGLEEWGIKALYVTPLRALNRDILVRMKELAAELGIRLEVRHGDTPQSARRRMALSPPHILITTPETLQFLLVGSRLREALRSVRWVVVDELHELMQSKRGLQLTIALERLEEIAEGRVQRIGLSATISKPFLAGMFLTGGRRFEVVEARGGRRYEVDVLYLASEGEAGDRVVKLVELIEGHRSTLVFTNTRDTAEALGSRLRRLCGDAVAVHHGSLSREERLRVERGLKEGRLKAVVATSSLELGIDVGHVDYVVQYMSPRQVNRLVQRVGRSSHFMGGVARGCIVAADLDDLMESIVIARRAERGDLEDLGFEENAYDVLAHQLVGLVLEYGKISLEKAHGIVTRAYPYRGLRFSELIRVAEFLDQTRLARLRGGVLYRGPRSIEYYYESASTIPDVEVFEVFDLAQRRRVGVLDGDFVASSLAEGSKFILGGRVWDVVRVSLEEERVYVAPSAEAEAAIPAWTGEDLPVPYKVAREVGALRRRLLSEPTARLAGEYGVDEGLMRELKEYVESQAEAIGVVPSDVDVVVEVGRRAFIVHACIGTRANSLLGVLLSHALAKLYGVSSKYYFDAYRVAVATSRGLTTREVRSLMERLEELIGEVGEAVKGSNAYLWKLLHVCQRMGIIRRGAKLKVPARKLAEALEGTVVEEEAVRELLHTRFDIAAIERLVRDLKRGRVRLHVVRVSEFSPMARSMFEKPYRAGLLIKGVEPLLVVEAVRRRLERSKLLLVCLHCLKWNRVIVIGDLEGEVRCPLCGSRVVAALNPWDEEALKVLRKWRRGERLTREERRVVKAAQQSAILVMSYGKKALLCLAGRGVGPAAATRILSSCRSYEELVREVAKAEANYARTREYWDS